MLIIAWSMVQAAEGVKLQGQRAIYQDRKGAALNEPQGVGCGGKSILAVADSGNGRLLSYTITEDSLIPGPEIRVPQVPYPIQVQITSSGDFLALDGRRRRIARITPTGEFREFVTPRGEVDPGSFIPRSFKIDRQDRIYILDVFQRRVLVLGPEDRLERQIAFPPEAGFMADLDVDSGGTVFALESVGRRLWVARPGEDSFTPLTGSLKEEMAFPTAIAADAHGRVFVLDGNGGGVVIFGSDGSFRGRQLGRGWKEGSLRYPTGLCFDDSDTLFVADRDNNRVQLFAVLE